MCAVKIWVPSASVVSAKLTDQFPSSSTTPVRTVSSSNPASTTDTWVPAGSREVRLHNSLPWIPSLALKNNVPFMFTKSLGMELTDPGLMSLTSTVPSSVPSLFHNSTPFSPSLAPKKSVPFTKLVDKEVVPKDPDEPGLMSLTITVPASVPLLFHNSFPWSES